LRKGQSGNVNVVSDMSSWEETIQGGVSYGFCCRRVCTKGRGECPQKKRSHRKKENPPQQSRPKYSVDGKDLIREACERSKVALDGQSDLEWMGGKNPLRLGERRPNAERKSK